MSFGIADVDQQVIEDMGSAGRDEAITTGVLHAMKALGVALSLNHKSLEGSVRLDIITKERDSLKTKVTGLEGDLSKAKEEHAAVISEKDKQIGSLQARYKGGEKAIAKLQTKVKDMEAAAKETDDPGEDERPNLPGA